MIRTETHIRLSLGLVLCCLSACHPYSVSSGDPDLAWTEIGERYGAFPNSISVFEGVDEKMPLRAWNARIDLNDPEISVHVLYSDDPDGMETTSEMALSAGSCIAVNAGYFSTTASGARHIGLLVANGQMLHTATGGIIVDGVRYPTARAAIGFFDGGAAEVAWVTTQNDSILAWPAPVPNKPGYPGIGHTSQNGLLWDVRDAVAAGPSLVNEGLLTVTVNEEIFFNTPIPNVHPRTAAGIRKDGSLILVVVDGRQWNSRGVSLIDLARIMIDLGAEYALNLDGGGSSSFVVNGQLVNEPEGSVEEREVVSAISIHCGAPDSVDK